MRRHMVAAIDDCTNNADRKCDVITYSIGSDGASSSISDAIDAFTSAGGLFVAAGVAVLSTCNDGGHDTTGGTSMSTPHAGDGCDPAGGQGLPHVG